jgi:hypothetical protein
MSQQILDAFSQIQEDANQISEDYQRRAHWRPGIGDLLYWFFGSRAQMRDALASPFTADSWQQPFMTLSSTIVLLSRMTLLVACLPLIRLMLRLAYLINLVGKDWSEYMI